MQNTEIILYMLWNVTKSVTLKLKYWTLTTVRTKPQLVIKLQLGLLNNLGN